MSEQPVAPVEPDDEPDTADEPDGGEQPAE